MHQPGQPPMFMLTWPDNRHVQTGLAGQYLMHIDSSTQLQFNARADLSSYALTSHEGKNQLAVFGYKGQHKDFFIPALSVQISRKLYQKIKGTLSLGINSRVPTASELFGFYLFNQFDGYDYIGNPELKQETAQQAELTLAWQEAKLKVQTTGYVSRVSHYILGKHMPALSVMTMGAKGVKSYQNIGVALLSGAEGSLFYTPFSQTQITATIKYAYAQDGNGAALPMIAPLRNITAVRQQINQLWLQAEMETAAAQNRVSIDANESKTGAFSLWHFRLGYQGRCKNLLWQLNAGAENIFNAYYREHLDWGNIARAGRNLYMQVGVGF